MPPFLPKLIQKRRDAPARTEIFDRASREWLATFTMGSYTVALSGPARHFCERRRYVETNTWIRVSPEPFSGNLNEEWWSLAWDANESRVPDILTIAFQYIAGSQRLYENGMQIAGNARYGPRSSGSREEGSDFNDYLGIVWEYADEPRDRPETRQFRSLDCSGFVRMVYGYRRSLPYARSSTVPICRTARADHSALPRRAHEMFTKGPGVTLIENSGGRPYVLDALAPGDLLFFDADRKDGPRLDHVGIYLGLDGQGHRRFISSRKRANGPTMSDIGGRSILDGQGLYARSFRSARRL